MNLQIAATLSGRVAAIGPVPVPGARHDAHAYAASGLKDLLAGLPAAADLGYLGVDGITIVPFRTPPGGHLHDTQATFNKDLSAIRAAAERAVASVKTWRMLSEEGGRYRARSANTPSCSQRSPDCFSSATTTRLMNKPPGNSRLWGFNVSETDTTHCPISRCQLQR